MKNNKIFITFITIFALISISTGCRIAKDRPILKVPDGNKDRMLKETFSGTDTDPKYWIYKVTVVKTSFGNDDLNFVWEGLQSEAKVGYFEFARDKLKFNNIVNRQSLETTEVASQGINELINEWDIKHSEFRLAEVDGYTTNREEENNYIKWNEKNHFTIDWSKADISEANTFPYSISYSQNIKCWNKKTSYVIDDSRDITDNYISFIVAVEYEQNPICSHSLKRWVQNNFTTTVHYKYSFKKVPDPRLNYKTYTPYIYTGEQDPLLKKYGYFRTVRTIIGPDKRDKNIFYMNRWNPDKKHIFYFSKDYPNKYKDIAHGVICHTNKLFAKHNLNNYPLNGKCKEDGSVLPDKQETCSKGICFELRENTGQEFGDIRYSFFHMLKIDIPILGYGPSDTHPATGEIISGNVIISIHLLDFYLKYLLQDRYKRDLKEYYDKTGNLIKNKKTKYENSSLFTKMKQTLKEKDHTLWTHTAKLIDKNSEIRSDFEYLLSQLTFGHPFYSQFTSSHAGVPQTNFHLDPLLLPTTIPKPRVKEIQKTIEQSEQNIIKQLSHERNTTIYPAEPVIAQLPSLLANGLTPDEIKRRFIFILTSHEFGHVLNLKHNFYGNVDIRHWHTHRNDSTILKTSSIMDYMNIKDEVKGPLRALFGPYDEAALVYAYSDGKKDLSKEKNTQYLFCTDHHRFLNALCNEWDMGSTPSEVTMSLIENYEENYFIKNLRINRAYWNTSYYPIEMFYTMWDMKRTLMMWREAFNDDHISKILDQSKKHYTVDDVNLIFTQIQRDIKQSIKLSMAFYNSVLQLSTADRDWKIFYNEESGSIEKIGIFWDKLFAMYFLMGDTVFEYNPNYHLEKASYITYIDDLGFYQMIEEIMENTLTVRMDMEIWFIDFGRFLYAQNASNFYNISSNPTLLEKIGVRCYTPKGLKDRFGIDPYAYKANKDSPPDFLDTAIISMEDYIDKITDTYYLGTNEKLGVTFFDGNYYVASSNLNKYSFTIIDLMKRVTHSERESLRLAKQDVFDTFYLYHFFKKNGVIPQNCDNGD